jgi:class 3 adenylate cyclase
MGRTSPTGRITLLLTDVVGSTRLWEAAPEAMDEALRRHDELVEVSVSEAGGLQLKARGEGDSTFSVFQHATDAANAALLLRAALRDEPWPEEAPIAVRMALHSGETVERDGDYYGTTVNRAARLRAVAGANQTLVSTATAADLEGRIPAGGRLVNLGTHPLRDLAGPEEVHALLLDGETPGTLDVGRAGDAAAGLPPALAAAAGTLVGREAELVAIESALGSPEASRLVVVAGDAGMGKTALLAAAARAATDSGLAVLYGGCEPGGRPYQPVADALDPWVAAAPSGVLGAHAARFGATAGRLLPSLLARIPPPNLPWTDVAPEQASLFAAIVDLLGSATVPGGAVLVLDDLQWADDETVQLVRHLVRSPLLTQLRVVLTHRAHDVGTGPAGPFLDGLRSDHGLVRVTLDGLDEARTAAVVLAEVGGELDADGGRLLASKLHAETGGNPFFVREIVRHLVARGDLTEHGATWRLARPVAELAIPDGVREVIADRVSALGPEAVDVLRSAAVIGTDFDLEVLARAVAIDEDALLDVLERAEAVGLLRESDVAGSFQFAHALVAQTLYDALGGERRRRRHRAVAEALADHWSSGPTGRAALLARHWIAGAGPADLEVALGWAESAAAEALAALAPQQAIAWVAEASALVDQLGDDERRRVRLGVLLGTAQRMAGDATYRDTLLDAARRAVAIADTESLVAAALANTRGIVASSGAVDDERVEVIQAALDAVGEDDSPARARLLGLLATELDDHPDWQRTEQLGREGREMAARLGDPPTVLHSLVHSGLGWRPHNLDERRLSVIPAAAALAEELGDGYAAFFAAAGGFAAEMQAAEPEAAERHLAHVVTLADRYPEPTLHWFSLILTGSLELYRGEMERAETLAEEAFALGLESGQPDASLWYAGQIGALRIEQGRAGELVPMLQALSGTGPSTGGIRSTLAFCLTEIDEPDEAAAILRDLHDHDFDSIPYAGPWLSSLGLCALVAAVVGDRAAGGAIQERLAPFEDQVIAGGPSISGPVATALGRLAVLRDDLEEADRLLAKGYDTMRELRAPYFVACAAEYWAEVAGRLGRPDQQRARLDEALALARRHGLARVEARCSRVLATVGDR